MAKFYNTTEEAFIDLNKMTKTIINAFEKKQEKYSNIGKYVKKTESGYEIRGTFEYPTYLIIVTPNEMFLKMDHWTEPRSLNDFNIGGLRGVVDVLIEFKKEMRYNFD